ncbi:MAG: cell division protein FtsH, partial [Spirochaetes bacterium]|nr:cell division protein FtsH [Spirochaetota bacterium]
LYGGYVAESIKFSDTSTGSSNDIERATELARRMVCEWGMSEKLGPLAFGKRNEQIFLGREIAQHRDYSEMTAELIDAEVKRIITEAEAKARQLICDNMDKFERIAQSLIERESLNAEEITMIMNGEELPPVQNGNGNRQRAATQEQAGEKDLIA